MIALLATLLAQQPARAFAESQTLQLGVGLEVLGAATADFERDGRREVVIAARTKGKEFARELEIWRAASGAGFALAETLPLTNDVVAYAIGDVRDGGGDELVLFNSGGAFAWRPGEQGELRIARIASADFLWQLADPEDVFLWERGLRDLDGDGLVDLVLPEPDGFTLVAQRRPRTADGAWGEVSRVRVPLEFGGGRVFGGGGSEARPRGNRNGSKQGVSIRVGGGGDAGERDGPSTLAHGADSVPVPQWNDWDGDGDLDLLAQSANHLHVWLQEPRGRFASAPALSLAMPVDSDGALALRASYSSHVVDLDLDAKADCAIFAGDERSDEIRAQALFFTQSKRAGAELFGAEGRPASVLVFAGFVSEAEFRDLDGDRFPELVLGSVRPDLIDQLRSVASETIETELFVYRNRKGVLAAPPVLSWRHAIPIKDFAMRVEFCGDLTGDGVSELFVRDAPERMRVLLVRPQGTGEQRTWSVIERPLWELAIDAEARIAIERARAKPEILVLEPTQVVYVRFP